MRAAVALLLCFGLWPAAWAAPGSLLDIRIGLHPTFSRLVLAVPRQAGMSGVPQTTRDRDVLVIALPGAGALRVLPSLTAPHVLGVQGGADQLRLSLQPDSTVRVWRMGARVVVDVFGPDTPVVHPSPAASPLAAPVRIVPGAATRTLPQPPSSPLSPRPPPPPPPAAPPAGPAPRPAQSRVILAVRPAPRAAEPTPPPIETAGAPEDASASPGPVVGAEAVRAVRLPGPAPAILLPFDAKVGAAAFAAGGLAHAVFDDRKAIDLAALREDPVFAGARITLSPSATQLSMVLPPRAQLSLRRVPEGWAVRVQRQPPDTQPAPVRLRGQQLSIAMKQAANVVVLLDPATGGRLLVGTVHDHGGGVVVPHISAEFRLLASWEGVAIGVTSDRLSLGVTREGFALGTASGPKLVAVMEDDTQAALESIGNLTRHFAIPAMDVPTLRQRLVSDIAAAAHAPAQARFRPRLRAAQDMLGLGMDREAAALLATARNDDPAQETRPDAAALQAMTGWLAGLGLAASPALPAIDNPGLGDSDEVALWRALMPPRNAAAPAAARAAVVAAGWHLLAGYPPPLRRRLMPQAATILIEGGALPAAEALLAAAGDIPMDNARARLLAAQGRLPASLAALDRISAGLDRKEAEAARRDATDLRLHAGLLKPEEAARALETHLYAWREPDFEMNRRLCIAALLTQAGAFRRALAGLRETDATFPQGHARVREAEDQAIRGLVARGLATLTPLDLLALVADNADLLGQGDIAASLTPMLVDKLAALDLPERADRLVGKLIESTADPVPKSMLGVRLAGLRLDQNDPAGALAALDQTMEDGLPADVDTRRAVARARALAQLGEDGPALSLLAAHDGAESWELAARLREKSHDWHGAEMVLQKLVEARVPAGGVLSAAQQDLVLRLAGAASQAGDGTILQALSAGAARRLSPGPRADLFAALTVQPVRDIADLPRSERDAQAARALPAAWAGYATH